MTNNGIIEKILKISGFKIVKYRQNGDLYEVDAHNEIIDEGIQLANRGFDFVLADLMNEIYQTNFENHVDVSASPNRNPFCGLWA